MAWSRDLYRCSAQEGVGERPWNSSKGMVVERGGCVGGGERYGG